MSAERATSERQTRGSDLRARALAAPLVARLLLATLASIGIPGCAGAQTVAAGPGAEPPTPPTTVAPAAPPLPPDLPAARDPGWGDLLDDRPDFARAPLGVGRLGPADPGSTYGLDWARTLALPVYREPGGTLRGWLARGWWLPTGGAPQAMRRECLVETDYETASFVLHAIRADGWLEVGLEPPCTGAGAAWVHRGHLGLGAPPLAVETWVERFLRAGAGPLHFRDPGRHALRAEPSTAGALIAWIGDDASIEPLEIRGDWLRARVAQPADVCREPGTWRGTRSEGWLRFASDDRGPWLWLSPRGC